MAEADFTRTSRAVWDAMAPGWNERHAYFEERARPVTELMLRRLDPRAGDTVLDVAAGTGVAGMAVAVAVGPEGAVVLGDFAESMVRAAEAQARALGLGSVVCRQLDAQTMDLPDDSVDGVVCRWGYMLMADPAAALRETRRVLRPGGRLACAVFADAARNPWAAIPGAVLQERGHLAPPESGAPGILALADRDRLRGLLVGAGFADPLLEDVPFAFDFAGPDDYWAYLTDAAGAIAMVLAGLGEAERARVRDEVLVRAGAFAGDGGIVLPAVSIVASAA